MNIFNDYFDRVDESRVSSRAASIKLLESVAKISNAQKKFYAHQRELSQQQVEIDKLQAKNKETKVALMKALVERDELALKKDSLMAMNERLVNQNDNLHQETDHLLSDDEVDKICERFSLVDQVSLLKEIHDARSKLLRYGYPMSYFA